MKNMIKKKSLKKAQGKKFPIRKGIQYGEVFQLQLLAVVKKIKDFLQKLVKFQ